MAHFDALQVMNDLLNSARTNPQSAPVTPQQVSETMKNIGIVVGTAIDNTLKSYLRSSFPNAKIPGFSDWRREMRTVELVLLLTMVHQFTASQFSNFQGLRAATTDGRERMSRLFSQADQIQKAVTTVFLHNGRDSAHQIVIDLKKHAPNVFWDYLWSI